jgi:hypothetical protein
MFNEVLFWDGRATSLEDQVKFLLLGAALQLLSTTRASMHLKPPRFATSNSHLHICTLSAEAYALILKNDSAAAIAKSELTIRNDPDFGEE